MNIVYKYNRNYGKATGQRSSDYMRKLMVIYPGSGLNHFLLGITKNQKQNTWMGFRDLTQKRKT